MRPERCLNDDPLIRRMVRSSSPPPDGNHPRERLGDDGSGRVDELAGANDDVRASIWTRLVQVRFERGSHSAGPPLPVSASSGATGTPQPRRQFEARGDESGLVMSADRLPVMALLALGVDGSREGQQTARGKRR